MKLVKLILMWIELLILAFLGRYWKLLIKIAEYSGLYVILPDLEDKELSIKGIQFLFEEYENLELKDNKKENL